MDEIREVANYFFLRGGMLTTAALFLAVCFTLWVLRMLARPTAHSSGFPPELTTALFCLMAFGMPAAIATYCIFFRESGPPVRSTSGFLAAFGLYLAPFVLMAVPLRRFAGPKLKGITCDKCRRFIHDGAWICDFCRNINKSEYLGKCAKCGKWMAYFLCPLCDQVFLINPLGDEYCGQILRDGAAPSPKEAALQAQLASLQDEERRAVLQQQIREKEEAIRRAREHSGLGQPARLRLEIEAEVERQLSTNLERKLVFKRMRQKIEADYGDDAGILRDAETVLDQLEERFKAEAMRRVPTK